MSSKRGKRNSRSKKSSSKQSEQLCMNVIDHGATISSSNAQNHFGYSPFKLTITVDPHCNDLEPQPLNVQLVFEDGQQIDCVNKNKNSIRFHTKPSTLYLDQHGQCKFTVQIDTHSMFHENRAFKLVFNLAENATRHIRPCETKPFRLVKHRLEIMQEPDDTFYKDEGGRANCLRCRILLKDSGGNIVKNRDIPLVAKLVYEDMSVAQSSRDILEILTQNVELKKGQCQVDFRINEVSKNHNKRAFRVLYECKSQDALYHDISSCVTNKIMVKSKRTKKKGTTSGGRGRGRGRTKSEPKKRKRSIKQIQKSPITESSEDIEDLDDIDMDSDDNIHDNRPRKRLRKSHPHTIGHGHNNHNSNNSMNPSINPYSHSFDPHRRSTLPPNVLNNMDINGDIMDNTQYVPPALTGILPSIRGGALPRIGHQPPPFASLSKKNNPLKSEKGIMGGGGVLGHMFNWCKLAGWVMNRLEWTHCGYEYDEATHSIDTTRPLYRCSYCLKYRNIAGWGTHENWCQLKLALKEYDTKVKTLHSEWNYQINNKGVDHEGGMTTMDAIDDGPPSNKDKDNNNNNSTTNADKDKNTSSSSNMALPSINNNGPTISTGFSVAVNNGLSVQTSNGLPSFIPNQSNGTLWGYATFQQQQGLGSINSIPNGLSSAGLGGFNNHQSPLMNYTLPPVQPQLNTMTPNHTQPTRNDNNNRNNDNINNNNNKQNINGVKPELLNGRNKNLNSNNADVHLPAALPKVASVARVRSQHGYDAFDKDNNFVGSFGDDGTFFEADQINDQYQPTFDSTQMMLTRNQSDDYLFYSNIRNSIGFDANSHK